MPKGCMILNQVASLDRHLRIDVYQDGRLIGDAFYAPYGAGETEFSKVGFGRNGDGYAIARAHKGESFREDAKYTFEFAPIALWKIEGKTLTGYESENKYWRSIAYEAVQRANHQTFISE